MPPPMPLSPPVTITILPASPKSMAFGATARGRRRGGERLLPLFQLNAQLNLPLAARSTIARKSESHEVHAITRDTSGVAQQDTLQSFETQIHRDAPVPQRAVRFREKESRITSEASIRNSPKIQSKE